MVSMRALVLAAGLGTRLGTLTKSTPKCLVELAPGVPILEVVLKKIEALGINEIVVNTHYLAEQVQNYLQKRKSTAKIITSHEPVILETGGAIVKAQKYLEGDDFLVHNGDIYSSFDLARLIIEHKSNNALITLGTISAESDRPLLCNDADQLLGWKNKKTGEELFVKSTKGQKALSERQFTGISIFSPKVLPELTGYGEIFSIVPAWLDVAKKHGQVFAPKISGTWVDIGTPEQLELAQSLYKKA